MHGHIFNVVGLERIIQGLHGLFVVNIAGRDASYHQAVGVTAEALFQNRRELAFSIWNVLLDSLLLVTGQSCNALS
jgi:hypothetical protein